MEEKKNELYEFLDKEIKFLYRGQEKNNKRKEKFSNGEFIVTNDLLEGAQADQLGYVIRCSEYYDDAISILSKLYTYLMSNEVDDFEKQVHETIDSYEETLKRYVTAYNVINSIDDNKRDLAKSLPNINNNVDVISQRDWYLNSYLKTSINFTGEMIDILKDLLDIIKN